MTAKDFDPMVAAAGPEFTVPSVRVIPYHTKGGPDSGTEPRVETGPVQFGNDWPGLFIRGDEACFYATFLESALRNAEARLAEEPGTPKKWDWVLMTLSNLARLFGTARCLWKGDPPHERAVTGNGVSQAIALAALLSKFNEQLRGEERERAARIARRLGNPNAAVGILDDTVTE